jgi:crotonobetainyl-CoA:carnitine CoA-transferase CaiB-like acyl-CoA transferase
VGLPLLSDIRVLELASMVSGPFCGRMLAFSGAEVIKIESPFCGDPSRRSEPFAKDIPGPDRSLLFQYLNANKTGITLDIATATGHDLFKKLVSESDVLIEDLGPGEPEDLGLGYDELAKLNSQLVMASITPFGQDGRHSRWKAYNLNTTHAGGSGWITPTGLSRRMHPDRPPLKIGGHVGDYYCGITAATAVMFAILARNTSGRGQHIDMSKQEAHLTLERNMVGMYANYGFLETADTQDFPYGGCFPCKDGYIEILAHEDVHWNSLVRMMGSPAWAMKEEYRLRATRRLHGEEINPGIESWTSRYTRAHVYRLGRRHGVPVGMFSTPTDVVQSRHERERGFFTKISGSNAAGITRIPSLPYKFSSLSGVPDRRAPSLGEHNVEIYCDRMGLERRELVRLAQAEIV